MSGFLRRHALRLFLGGIRTCSTNFLAGKGLGSIFLSMIHVSVHHNKGKSVENVVLYMILSDSIHNENVVLCMILSDSIHNENVVLCMILSDSIHNKNVVLCLILSDSIHNENVVLCLV